MIRTYRFLCLLLHLFRTFFLPALPDFDELLLPLFLMFLNKLRDLAFPGRSHRLLLLLALYRFLCWFLLLHDSIHVLVGAHQLLHTVDAVVVAKDTAESCATVERLLFLFRRTKGR